MRSKVHTFPTAKELDLFDEEVPEGLALCVMPPAREHMWDPFWWDQGGRDPIDQKFIFRMQPGLERTQKLQKVIEEFPRHGPKMYEKCAEAGRADIIRELLSLGVSMDIERAKQRPDDLAEDEEDEDAPMAEMEPAIISAAFAGHLECIEVLVEEGNVDMNTIDAEIGTSVLGIAAIYGYVEIVEWLLNRGAVITYEREKALDDIEGLIRCGKVDLLSRVLVNEQSTARNFQLTYKHLPYAAASKGPEMLTFVLERVGFPSPPAANSRNTEITLPALSSEQREPLIDGLYLAIKHRQIENLRLILSYLTSRRADGSFEFLVLEEGAQANVFNSTEDAMEGAYDISELFELVWETLLCTPREQLDKSEELREKQDARINRRLISACTEACPETVKLIVEKYGADVNHVSHKISSTPLGRAAGSHRNPLAPRLEIAKYLLERPGIDIHLANGEYSNGITPLGMAIQGGKSQIEMVKLLLQYGGPVELIEDALMQEAEAVGPGETMSLCAVVCNPESRSPVKIVTQETCDLIRDTSVEFEVVLELDGSEAKCFLDNLQARKSDSALAQDDPKKRPLG